MAAIKLFTLGRAMTQFQLTALVADASGNLTASGAPGSFLGRWDEASDEHEEELENIQSVDQFGANWVSTGADDTYNVTELLTNVLGQNVIYNFWKNGSPGARWVNLTATFGNMTDSFDGYMQRYSRGPLKRGKNTASMVLKRIEIGTFNPNLSGG